MNTRSIIITKMKRNMSNITMMKMKSTAIIMTMRTKTTTMIIITTIIMTTTTKAERWRNMASEPSFITGDRLSI